MNDLAENLKGFLELATKKPVEMTQADWFQLAAYGQRCVDIMEKTCEADPKILEGITPKVLADLLATALRATIAQVMIALAKK